MSWFDTAVFATLAKSALNSAQKTIDRALDIQEDASGVTVTQPKQSPNSPSKLLKTEEDEFFSAFGLSTEPTVSSTSEDSAKTSSPVKSPKYISPDKQSGTWGDWSSAYLPRLEASVTESNTTEFQNISSSIETALPEEPSTSDSNVPATVSVQPIAEKLFPSSQEDNAKNVDESVCTDISCNQIIISEDITDKIEIESTAFSVSISEMILVQLDDQLSSDIPVLKHETTISEVTPNLDSFSENNESGETLHDLSDDDDDETEEELTIMEKRPPKNLDLPLTSCFPTNDASPSDYCFVEEMESSQTDSIEKQFSCSASMEIISGNAMFEEDESKINTTEAPIDQMQTPSQELFSSPDSVIPIEEEPPSDLASPHFPEIHIAVPSSPKSNTMDMCDSDVTILSPSAGEEESTDSEKESTNVMEKVNYREPEDIHEFETSSSGSKTSSSSSSGSFVNCSLEDGDACTREHSRSSTIASDQKHETETSGHTSGDDMETTTSSDIEIISPSNGEGHPLSPLKHLWVPTRRTKRSESPASDSSKEGMMPVVHELEELMGMCSGSSGTQGNEDELFKRVAFLQEVLEAREKRALELSQENTELHESNSRLRSRIERMEETHVKDSEGVSKMTREFSQRLSQIEAKLEDTMQERNSLEDQLTNLKIATTSKLSIGEMEILIVQKDQQIAELMQEGEKLSKQQLNLSNIIKKLRTKEKEAEGTLKSQREKLDDQSKEIDRLRKSLGAKDEQEKKHIDAIRQLTTTITKQEEDLAALKNDLEDANDKYRSMKTNMDTAYKEMTNAQKQLAEKESQVQEATMSAEMVAKEALRLQLEHAQEESSHERETLLSQAAQLQYTLNKAEQQANLREESLKTDIANLQKRLEEADSRNADLTQSVSTATRPLLRQLENLQSSLKNQSLTWDKVEENLRESLATTQSQLSSAKEQEKSLRDQVKMYLSKIDAHEMKSKTLNHEKIQLTSQLEVLKAKISLSEDSKHRDAKSISSLKQKFAEEILQLKTEKEAALRQIEVMKLECEKKKEPVLEEAPEDLADRASPSLSMTLSHHSSVSESFRAWGQDVNSEVGYDLGPRPSYPEQWWGGSATSMIETLQSQVKQRDGEIQQLQREVSQLESVRDSMVEELGLLARRTDELQIELSDHQMLTDSFKDTEQKYNTLLQMYGEKVEEAEELKLDLTDVKTMYRAQIEELLKKS